MKTSKFITHNMIGNKDIDSVIFDICVEKYGMKEVCDSNFDFDNAIYSDGFINAIERGLVPNIFNIKNAYEPKYFGEYHHVIINDECLTIYFN